MTQHLRTAAVAAAFGVLAAGWLYADADKPMPFDDAEFVAKAASSGKHEVALNTLALERAKSDELKQFAQKIVADHSKANKELMAVAQTAKFTVPEQMMPEHRKHVDHFKSVTDDFDKEFAKHMVKDHEKAVKMFSRAAKEAKDPTVRAFAEKTLPTLEEHLAMAKKLAGQVK